MFSEKYQTVIVCSCSIQHYPIHESQPLPFTGSSVFIFINGDNLECPSSPKRASANESIDYSWWCHLLTTTTRFLAETTSIWLLPVSFWLDCDLLFLSNAYYTHKYYVVLLYTMLYYFVLCIYYIVLCSILRHRILLYFSKVYSL